MWTETAEALIAPPESMRAVVRRRDRRMRLYALRSRHRLRWGEGARGGGDRLVSSRSVAARSEFDDARGTRCCIDSHCALTGDDQTACRDRTDLVHCSRAVYRRRRQVIEQPVAGRPEVASRASGCRLISCKTGDRPGCPAAFAVGTNSCDRWEGRLLPGAQHKSCSREEITASSPLSDGASLAQTRIEQKHSPA